MWTIYVHFSSSHVVVVVVFYRKMRNAAGGSQCGPTTVYHPPGYVFFLFDSAYVFLSSRMIDVLLSCHCIHG